jgi:hypothetical protein
MPPKWEDVKPPWFDNDPYYEDQKFGVDPETGREYVQYVDGMGVHWKQQWDPVDHTLYEPQYLDHVTGSYYNPKPGDKDFPFEDANGEWWDYRYDPDYNAEVLMTIGEKYGGGEVWVLPNEGEEPSRLISQAHKEGPEPTPPPEAPPPELPPYLQLQDSGGDPTNPRGPWTFDNPLNHPQSGQPTVTSDGSEAPRIAAKQLPHHTGGDQYGRYWDWHQFPDGTSKLGYTDADGLFHETYKGPDGLWYETFTDKDGNKHVGQVDEYGNVHDGWTDASGTNHDEVRSPGKTLAEQQAEQQVVEAEQEAELEALSKATGLPPEQLKALAEEQGVSPGDLKPEDVKALTEAARYPPPPPGNPDDPQVPEAGNPTPPGDVPPPPDNPGDPPPEPGGDAAQAPGDADEGIPGVGVPYKDYIPFLPMVKDPATGEWRNAEPAEIPEPPVEQSPSAEQPAPPPPEQQPPVAEHQPAPPPPPPHDGPATGGEGLPDGNADGIPGEYGDGPDLDGNGVPDEIGINPDGLQPGYPNPSTSGDWGGGEEGAAALDPTGGAHAGATYGSSDWGGVEVPDPTVVPQSDAATGAEAMPGEYGGGGSAPDGGWAPEEAGSIDPYALQQPAYADPSTSGDYGAWDPYGGGSSSEPYVPPEAAPLEEVAPAVAEGEDPSALGSF